MATLKPFCALRPKPELAKDICAPPYDVMNSQEAKEMAEGNPLSFLRVSKPEIELADGVDPYSSEVYEHGAKNLRKMIDEGSLFQDDVPQYYLYRLTMGSHKQLGLVAVASCAEYDNGIVKKHELTRPDKEDDRTRHINILGAQTGPVFLTYRAEDSIDALMASQVERTPDYDYVADDNIRHEAWVVSDAEVIEKIKSAFEAVPALYVADGHHRSAAASRVAKARSEENNEHTGEEPYNYFLTVTFPHDQMLILGYNRVVKDLNGHDAAAVRAELEKLGTLTPVQSGDPLPSKKNEITVYLDDAWQLFTWNDESAKGGDDAASRLDVAILQEKVLTPILGVGNPRTDKRIAFVGGIRGTKELERLVDSDNWAIAFAMHPTSVEELMEIADEDGLMPPKSTWFEPKLRDAMMTHLI